MEDRETPQMRIYGESKITLIMMATVPHVTSGSGLRKFQADGFLFNRVYPEDRGNSSSKTLVFANQITCCHNPETIVFITIEI